MILVSLLTILALAEPGVTGSVDAPGATPDTTTSATSGATASTPDTTRSVAHSGATTTNSGSTSTLVAEPWIRRHRPRVHDLSIGVFGGILTPARGLAVHGVDATGEYAGVAPELGARLGYYPSRFFGLEGELSAAPTRFADARATLYAARAHAVIQAGFWRVVPFASLGGGVLGVVSDPSAAGRDAKPALSVGGGVKLHASERVTVRVDVRDVVTEATVAGAKPTHSAQALLTVALRFGVAPKPPAPAPAPPDEDGDGIADADDWCSREAGDDPHGCPYRDRDCDTIKDNVDACPESAGVAPDGCPPPDGDGDGIVDADDLCPELAGPAPGGCPDVDGDGLFAPADRCPDEAETVNGYADGDGCPDELPAAVKRFSGIIAGINFDSDRATIRDDSRPLLDEAAAVLRDHEEIRLEIGGHTDDRGRRERNVDLSQARADAVKAYLIDRGVAGERLEARGFGPDKPIADNKAAAGRAQNRRIEFRILER